MNETGKLPRLFAALIVVQALLTAALLGLGVKLVTDNASDARAQAEQAERSQEANRRILVAIRRTQVVQACALSIPNRTRADIRRCIERAQQIQGPAGPENRKDRQEGNQSNRASGPNAGSPNSPNSPGSGGSGGGSGGSNPPPGGGGDGGGGGGDDPDPPESDPIGDTVDEVNKTIDEVRDQVGI